MAAPVAEGDVILGKYRVERVLGQGGMGVVVAATHVELDQKVALKFLLPEALAHSELVERFAREARAAARIQSQHVARVIDTGKMPNGAPFMVMEYLEGTDLADLLEKDGRLSPAVAIEYVLQACEAISEAHAAGIVHRDLKPANLFLAKQRDRRAIVKVLDFGISKVEDPKAAPLTRTATMMGSPHYMSPEQLMSSKDVDARTDIWSLGVILYELMAGVRPFEAETMPEIVGQILKNQPARLGTLRGDLPLDLELVVARCLQSSPADRFASVADLAAALQPFAGDVAAASASVSRIARVLGGASVPPAAPATVRDSRPDLPTAIDSSRRIAIAGPPSSSTFAMSKTAHAVSISQTQDSPTPKKRSIVPFAAAGVVLLAGAGAVVGLRGSGKTAPAQGIVAAPTPSPSLIPSPSPSLIPSPSPTPEASAATTSTSTTASTSTSTSTRKISGTATGVKAPPTATASSKNPLDMGIK